MNKGIIAFFGVLVAGGAVKAMASSASKQSPLTPVKGPITSPFNEARAGGTYHNGTDISVPVGTPVLCPLDGTVLSTYFNAEGGNQIIINHANGVRTGYAHLSKILVKPGQKVQRGTTIANSGNTGHSTGPHLHFTLTINNQLADPAKYFKF